MRLFLALQAKSSYQASKTFKCCLDTVLPGTQSETWYSQLKLSCVGQVGRREGKGEQ